MPLYLLLVAGALLLFGKKPSVPTASTASNTGGTSTPTPTKTIPPFYQFNNAATGSMPVTTESFTPIEGLYPANRLTVPHNNLLLAGVFDSSPSQPVRVPISADLISPTQDTSVAEEQALSWQNNNVGGTNVKIVASQSGGLQ